MRRRRSRHAFLGLSEGPVRLSRCFLILGLSRPSHVGVVEDLHKAAGEGVRRDRNFGFARLLCGRSSAGRDHVACGVRNGGVSAFARTLRATSKRCDPSSGRACFVLLEAAAAALRGLQRQGGCLCRSGSLLYTGPLRLHSHNWVMCKDPWL